MNLEKRLQICSEILEEYLPFISQMDMDIIENFDKRIKHTWMKKVESFNDEELIRFDADREFELLDCPNWIDLINKIRSITKFDKVEVGPRNLSSYGNLKKQHELSTLYSYLEDLKSKEIEVVDFGGGVGNLAFFLEDELQMIPTVIEKDLELIRKGESRVNKKNSKICFEHSLVDQDFRLEKLGSKDLGIGLHTCGNFAVDMIKTCAAGSIKQVLNLGCCYSKIQDNQYHFSSKANRSLIFNSRALAGATLGFGKTTREIYDFRIRIMNYKFSFYHYIYKHHGILEFCPMSNSRRSLYQLSFFEFMTKSLEKYYPDFKLKDKEYVDEFYKSKANTALNSYFQNYYSISRYIGEVLEIYLLCDRALYLQELGYNVEIKQFFDPNISPRNKGIIGLKNELSLAR